MSNTNLWPHRIMIALVAFTLCGGPQIAAAQQEPQTQTQDQQQTAPPATQDQTQDQNQPQNLGTSQESATPDPSKGPLKPTDQLPNAPSASQASQDSSSAASSKQQQQQNKPAEVPLGAAAAQAGKTSGGTASKPAGMAIAPAKQRQTRSLLIKVGAIAAGAAALGIVYGLSRGTSSAPPGAASTTVAH